MSLRKEIKDLVTDCRYEWKKHIINTKKNIEQRKTIDEYTDEILDILKKHGYKKIEKLDGYWSD